MITLILKDDQGDWFDLIQYPDGQKSICLKLDKLNKKEIYTIKCRIKDFSQLEVLLCCLSALEKNDVIVTEINFVYLFGIRSDRSFNIGEPNYFKQVILPIIKNIGIKCKLLWPFTPLPLLDNSVYRIINDYSDLFLTSQSICISGDKTSLPMAQKIGFNTSYFNKTRDDNKVKCELNVHFSDLLNDFHNLSFNSIDTIWIVDDLCDGGNTFIAGAKCLREKFQGKLKLFIYHGLFTKGLGVLLEYFDEILCTNSYQDIDNPRVKQIKVI